MTRKNFGLNFLVGSYKQVTDQVVKRLMSQKLFILLPCSLNDLSSIHRDKTLSSSYQNIDIFTLDGMPLVFFMNRIRKVKCERVYGPDLMKTVLMKTQQEKITHILFGGSKKALNNLKKEILNFSPKTNIVEMISPPYRKASQLELQAYLRILNQYQYPIVWIGLSSPKQAVVAHYFKKHLNKGAYFCVGAAFDFLSKEKTQAPKIMMRLGLEWFFRLITEPNRLWKRYLVEIPVYLLIISLDQCVKQSKSMFFSFLLLVRKLAPNPKLL